VISINYSHGPAQNQHEVFNDNWSTIGVKMNHEQIRIHKTHHDSDLGEATTFPLIVYYVLLHEVHIQMAFCLETLKWESRNCRNLSFGLVTKAKGLQGCRSRRSSGVMSTYSRKCKKV